MVDSVENTVKGEVVPLPKHHNREASRGSVEELHTFLISAVDDNDEQVHQQTCISVGIITPNILTMGETHSRSGPSRGEEFLPWPL